MFNTSCAINSFFRTLDMFEIEFRINFVVFCCNHVYMHNGIGCCLKTCL